MPNILDQNETFYGTQGCSLQTHVHLTLSTLSKKIALHLFEKSRDVWEAVPYENLAETLVVGDGILDVPKTSLIYQIFDIKEKFTARAEPLPYEFF